MTTIITKSLFVVAYITLCVACDSLMADESPGAATKETRAETSKTATNLDDIDLHDTTEDPAYATAGEELARDAAIDVIGKSAPLAVMTTIDGEQIDLSTIYSVKPVYLKFWATWCTPCRQQMPSFEAAYKAYGKKMQFIAVNIGYSDDENSVRAFRDKFSLTMPIVIDDGALAKLFHVNVTPQHVLIGKDVRFRYIGHAKNKELEHALAEALLDEQGDVAEARSVEVENRLHIGATVPDISVRLISGDNMPLKAKSGRLLAVQFFSSWCEWYLESSRPETSKACARVREAIEDDLAPSTIPGFMLGLGSIPFQPGGGGA